MIATKKKKLELEDDILDIEFELDHSHKTAIDKEIEQIEDTVVEVNQDDVFYDIGAAIGIYSCVVSRLCGSDIVAFEPIEDRRKIWMKNLVDSNGEAKIYSNKIGNGEHGNPLSELVEEYDLPKPDVVKIDVEGMEYRVLQGLEGLIDDIRTIYIEIHHINTHMAEEGERIVGIGVYGDRPRYVYNYLRENGFSVDHLIGRSKVHNIKAKRQ